jgi:hypothetical protein
MSLTMTVENIINCLMNLCIYILYFHFYKTASLNEYMTDRLLDMRYWIYIRSIPMIGWGSNVERAGLFVNHVDHLSIARLRWIHSLLFGFVMGSEVNYIWGQIREHIYLQNESYQHNERRKGTAKYVVLPYRWNWPGTANSGVIIFMAIDG